MLIKSAHRALPISMPTFLDLDIPVGLEDLWNKIFRPIDVEITNFLSSQIPVKRKSGYMALVLRSFFVMWQSLYNSFSVGRRASWNAYWLTLPFGSHSGTNGWPGSGFSAFIYANAPRYKLGLDLLLDPPGGFGDELLVNGNFTGNDIGWDHIGDGWLYGNNRESHVIYRTAPLIASGPDFYHLSGAGAWGILHNGQPIKYASQVSIVGTHSLKQVAYAIEKIDSPDDSVILSVYQGGTTPENGTLIGTKSVAAADIPDKNNYIYFVFATPLTLVTGTYFFTITRSGAYSASPGFYFHSQGDAVSGIVYWDTYFGSWASAGNSPGIILSSDEFREESISQLLVPAPYANYKFLITVGGTVGGIHFLDYDAGYGFLAAGDSYSQNVIFAGEGDFLIIPSQDFDGFIDALSLKQIL